jgi:hypothetical protein
MTQAIPGDELERLRRENQELVHQLGQLDELQTLRTENRELAQELSRLQDRATDLELEVSSAKSDLDELLDSLGVSQAEWKLTANALDRVAALARLKGGPVPARASVAQCTCSNCNRPFLPSQLDGLVVVLGSPGVAAAICPDCSRDTKVVKIVLRRGSDGRLTYEQYSALEMVNRAFGSVA